MALEIFQRALLKWGAPLQFMMAIEECSELIKAVVKYTRSPSPVTIQAVCEEVADVEIMCAQLRVVFGTEKVDAIKAAKLERLKGMLDKEKVI